MHYEYLCEQCHREFEAQQKISDSPLEECPLCREDGNNSPAPKRLISLGSFQLKGSGWGASGYS